MRLSTAVVAGAAAAAVAASTASAAEQCFADTLYGNGAPTFRRYEAPGSAIFANQGREPTIGINLETGSIFYMAFTYVAKINFDENDDATWTDVTPLNSIQNLDPYLISDPDTGRIFAGGLNGPCSIMSFSDDDGATWIPTANMCTGAQLDHQTLASGPPAKIGGVTNSPLARHVYYCSQLVTTACATSYDGGVTYAPFTQLLGGCAGLHGHLRISRKTGIAVVPDGSCDPSSQYGALLNADICGFGYTEDNGVTWLSRFVEGSVAPNSYGYDPSVAFTDPSGWMYYGVADANGPFMALTKDEGLTWEKIGGGMGVEPTTYLNIGQFHEPAIVATDLSNVMAGDDDRAAFSFIGIADEDGDGTNAEFPFSAQCETGQDALVWYYYVAFTYDAGETWEVIQASDNTVQVGGVSGPPCRNLLDFNDMRIDATGRVVIGYGDGCINDCEIIKAPGTAGYRNAAYSALLRQDTGKSLYARFDVDEEPLACNYTAPGDISNVLLQRELTQPSVDFKANSCYSNCGSNQKARAASGCSCAPECASDSFDQECCSDFAEVCLAQTEEETREGIEVSVKIDGNYADVLRKFHHLQEHTATHFGVDVDRVRLYKWNRPIARLTMMVFPKADATQVANLVFRPAAYIAESEEAFRGNKVVEVETEVVRFGDHALYDHPVEQQNSAASTAGSDEVNPAYIWAPLAIVGSLSLGAIAGCSLMRVRYGAQEKRGLSAQDSLQSV